MSEFNYKITYTFSQCFPKIDRKVIKIKTETVNLAFESEPSEYELLSKVKTWVNELQQNVMNLRGLIMLMSFLYNSDIN